MLTKQEAKKAIEALAHTHLYGRHLVVEYAKDALKSVDELRHEAQKQLTKK
jgi:multiple RNA-binding domain-containing protein 1